MPKPRATLEVELVENQFNGTVAAYTATRNSGPARDWAIRHTGSPSGRVYFNRVYWNDNGRHVGEWNITVEGDASALAELWELGTFGDPTDDVLLATLAYSIP